MRRLSLVWQRRYFELPLGSTHLVYFRSKQSREQPTRFWTSVSSPSKPRRPRGAIDLSRVTQVFFRPGNDCAIIDLVYDDANSLYSLKSDDAEEARGWYNILQRRVKLCDHVDEVIKRSCSQLSPSDERLSSSFASHAPSTIRSQSRLSTRAETKASEMYECKRSPGGSVGGGGGGGECDEPGLSGGNRPLVEESDAMQRKRFEDSPGADLTDEETSVLRDLVGRVSADPTLRRSVEIHLRSSADNDLDNLYFVCRRILAGRKFDVAKSLDTIRKIARWREEEDVAQLVKPGRIEELVDSECLKEMRARHPVVCLGADLDNRCPVVWKYFGAKCKVHEILKGPGSVKDLTLYHIYWSERALRCLTKNSKMYGRNIEKFRVVIDATGWNLGLFSRSAARFLYAMAKADQEYYVERMASCWIINAPRSVEFCWKVVRRWIDARTEERVKIIGPRDEWLPLLTKYIPTTAIPTCYGGAATDSDAAAYDRAIAATKAVS